MMAGKMDNKEMLEKIKQDRKNNLINEVISYKENEYGFYDVNVDMQSDFFGTKVLHSRCTLPYPYDKFEKLSSKEKSEWQNKNM